MCLVKFVKKDLKKKEVVQESSTIVKLKKFSQLNICTKAIVPIDEVNDDDEDGEDDDVC